MDKDIYVTRPAMPPIDEYREYLRDIWDSRNLTNMGKYFLMFTEEIKSG